MDVQMDPCMQTSRIRHALSSVQLFIERCLMNLEPRVSPAAINAKQWEWMKRYRVWEANRKVFLLPENWLEPELRDDKSPFFKEIESELLQSDITEDSATTALLNYLSKLEEVAKLEPCGIYHVEADQSRRTGEIDHVIARTAGAHRKYYYRRRDERLLDAVGAGQAGHRGQPGDSGGLEGPPVAVLAADSEAGTADSPCNSQSRRQATEPGSLTTQDILDA